MTTAATADAAAETTAAAPTPIRPQIRAAAPARLDLAQSVRATHRLKPIIGTTVEDVLQRTYWSHVANQLAPGDIVEVYPECNTWFAQFLVVDAGKFDAHVVLMHAPIEIQPKEPDVQTGDFVAKWISPNLKYGVRRASDGTILANGMATMGDAQAWIQRKAASIPPAA